MTIDESKFVYTIQTMSWENWSSGFRPAINQFDGDAKFGSKLFEHQGEQWEFISGRHAQQLWTIVEEDGILILRNGLHVRNKRGYFFCERWHNPSDIFKIPVPQHLVEELSIV
jgi:hypothetical protein